MTQVTTKTTDIAVYVPFGGQRFDLGEEAIAPAPEYPLLQYATGLPAQITKIDKHGQPLIDEETCEVLIDNILYAGFFTEIGKDKALDEAMRAINAQPIAIMHGNGEQKQHWMMQNPAVFLVAKGIPGNAAGDGSLGIVYTWRKKRNSVKSESVIYLQVMIRKLLPNYTKPFVLTLKSTQTIDCLNAIKKQIKVLQRAHEELQKAGNDMPLPVWSYSFHIAPSKKPAMRGPEGGQQKQIFPMLASIPDEISPAYLQRHEISLEYIDLLKDATEKSAEWAKGLTQRVVAGIEPHEPWQQETGGGMVNLDEPPF